MSDATSTEPFEYEWVSAREAERILREKRRAKISRNTIADWVRRGLIHHMQLPSGRYLVSVDEISAIATPRLATPRQSD